MNSWDQMPLKRKLALSLADKAADRHIANMEGQPMTIDSFYDQVEAATMSVESAEEFAKLTAGICIAYLEQEQPQ